jgi:hypothetical protein
MSEALITPRGRARPAPPRRLPAGYGLAAGAAASLGLWAGLAALAFRLLG